MGADARTSMEVEQEDEEVEAEVAIEISMHTQELLANQVVSTPTSTPAHT